ncbi:hypothetical protein H5410_006412 [Solanum commersonii]|uniref:Uncharacterized protein n=1 Tax=Solanum commersonii TaxID=4109 RepID=A0A9J6AAD5_SOLCO|nr:hypothetical protein H5410_006412 [Solanum commersonii]
MNNKDEVHTSKFPLKICQTLSVLIALLFLLFAKPWVNPLSSVADRNSYKRGKKFQISDCTAVSDCRLQIFLSSKLQISILDCRFKFQFAGFNSSVIDLLSSRLQITVPLCRFIEFQIAYYSLDILIHIDIIKTEKSTKKVPDSKFPSQIPNFNSSLQIY